MTMDALGMPGWLGPLADVWGPDAGYAAAAAMIGALLIAAGLLMTLAGAVARDPRMRAAGGTVACGAAAVTAVTVMIAFSAVVGAAALACVAAAGWVWLTRGVPATR